MGGERFDTPQPEAYLFGENVDLNFLGSRPTPVSAHIFPPRDFNSTSKVAIIKLKKNFFQFPYPPPQANEPTKTLKNLVNIRKESVRFVKAPESVLQEKFPNEVLKDNKFNIEFTFDSDVKCSITLYYFCTEEITNTGLV